MAYEKVIREGKVAVLYSPSFGAGWVTWNSDHPEILFHPKLVQMVEENRQNEITDEWMLQELGIEMYAGGAESLRITWLPEGTAFTVEEYDGSESIRTMENLSYVA